MPYITSVEKIGIEKGKRSMIENILKVRFGSLDEQLSAIIPALLELSEEECTQTLLQLSRDELVTRFSTGK